VSPVKPVGLAALLAPLVLAGCGGSGSAKSEMAQAYCPTPQLVQDATRLTRFKPGPGRDPRDIMFEAAMNNAASSCTVSRDRLDVEIKLLVAVTAGPSVAGGTTSVPYFVRVIDSQGNVTQGRDFNADFKLAGASPRGQSLEELTLTLPFGKQADLNGYGIAVGLKPTPEELQYNRRNASVGR